MFYCISEMISWHSGNSNDVFLHWSVTWSLKMVKTYYWILISLLILVKMWLGITYGRLNKKFQTWTSCLKTPLAERLTHPIDRSKKQFNKLSTSRLKRSVSGLTGRIYWGVLEVVLKIFPGIIHGSISEQFLRQLVYEFTIKFT